MRNIISAFLCGISFITVPAFADTQVVIKENALVTTADGKRIGRIYELRKAKDGTVTSVAIIKDDRMIHVPASTLTAGEKGLITSLTSQDLKPKP